MSGIASFGPGIAIITRTDVTPATPINAGFCQSLQISEKGTTKSLYGQNQYPLVSARSTVKSTGKLVAAVASGIAMNAMFYGQSFVSGGIQWNIGEAGTVPGVSTYTVTVANSATFETDLGVIHTATGLPFQKVASGPAVNQYSVAAGVYTFAAADANAAVNITYASTIAGGQSLIVTNQPIGFTPTFQLDYYTSLNQPTPKPFIHRLYACIASGLDMSFKLEDFMMPSFDFEFFANAANKVREIVFPEVS